MICRYDLRSVQCFTGAGKVRSTVDDSAKIPCTVHRVAPVRSTEEVSLQRRGTTRSFTTREPGTRRVYANGYSPPPGPGPT